MMSTVLVLVGAPASAGVQAGDLDAVKALIGEIKVRIEHHEELHKAAGAIVPPRKSESWKFTAGGVDPTVRYGRCLNRPPDFTGVYPSLGNKGFDLVEIYCTPAGR